MDKEKKERVINSLCSKAEDISTTPSFLQLYITMKCQLNCRYCRLNNTCRDMDFSEIKKAIDFLFTSYSDELRLQFFGGEPLIRFDMVKAGAEYAKNAANEKGKKVKLLIATNGILLTKEKIEFLKKKDFSVVFSFDGIKESQNLNRPPFEAKKSEEVYSIIENNLEKLVKSGMEFFVNVVAGPKNISSLHETVDFLVKKNVKNIRISYMMGAFWEKGEIEEFFSIVSSLFAKCASMNPKVTINSCKDEPVIVSSGLAATSSMDLFTGTTFPLMHAFPSLKLINYFGNIGQIKDINKIKRNKSQEIRKALELSSSQKEFSLMANNLFMGINYQNLFKRLEKKHRITNQNWGQNEDMPN